MVTDTVQTFPARDVKRSQSFVQIRFACFRAATWLTRMRLQQWLALALLLGSAVLWIAIWKLEVIVSDITAETAALHRRNLAATTDRTPVFDPPPLAPPAEQFFTDLKALFKVAKSAGVVIGMVDYKREPRAMPALVTHQVELHLTDNYPRMKVFIAGVLAELPNAALQELRVERQDALSPQAAMMVRFSFIYQGTSSASAVHQ